jgi:hypothetical protein
MKNQAVEQYKKDIDTYKSNIVEFLNIHNNDIQYLNGEYIDVVNRLGIVQEAADKNKQIHRVDFTPKEIQKYTIAQNELNKFYIDEGEKKLNKEKLNLDYKTANQKNKLLEIKTNEMKNNFAIVPYMKNPYGENKNRENITQQNEIHNEKNQKLENIEKTTQKDYLNQKNILDLPQMSSPQIINNEQKNNTKDQLKNNNQKSEIKTNTKVNKQEQTKNSWGLGSFLNGATSFTKNFTKDLFSVSDGTQHITNFNYEDLLY